MKNLPLIIGQIERSQKFDKEITKAKLLKYMIMNCSYEFLVAQ